jgi:hypothetical protein
MNVPPGEAKALSIWEYEALIWNWNDAEGGNDVEPPDPALTMKLIDRINANPDLGAKGKKEPMKGMAPA